MWVFPRAAGRFIEFLRLELSNKITAIAVRSSRVEFLKTVITSCYPQATSSTLQRGLFQPNQQISVLPILRPRTSITTCN
jgi:hypothetical protein